LVRNGYDPQLFGMNWPKLGKKTDLRCGPIPPITNPTWAPAWLVIPWLSHAGIKLAVNALARQSVVVMRGRADDFAREYPRLADLANAIHWFQTEAQLVAAMRSLHDRAESVAEAARINARKVLTEHTMASRITALLQHVRNRLDHPDNRGNC
jgi:hypothetical protein